MDSFIEHIEQLLVILFAAHALALAIVNLTSTPKDDEAIAKLYRILEIFAGLITKLSKK